MDSVHAEHHEGRTGPRSGGVLLVLAGPLLGASLWLLLGWLAPEVPEGGRRVAGLLAWMAAWWILEVVPLGVTALLPLVLLPMFGVLGVKEAAAPYAERTIFLFMGGFVLALAMERWHLHRRIALAIMWHVGSSPRRLVLGVMLATAALSMWVSNTATTLMLMPIALGIAGMVESGSREGGGRCGFGVAMVLGVAYAASIGGLGTPIGSPPNAVLTSYLDRAHAHSIGFGNWMLAGIPFILVFIPVAWAYLVFVACPVRSVGDGRGRAYIAQERAALGRISAGERGAIVCFALTVGGWVLREPAISLLESGGFAGAAGWLKANVDDAAIAMIGAILTFVVPADRERRQAVMGFDGLRRVPWEILLLFGGGLSLAAGVQASGLDKAMGGALRALGDVPEWTLVLVCTSLSVFVSEFTSNVAQANVFYPVIGPGAAAAGMDPLTLLFPSCFALSCAFMLPMGTPPNAIAFATGRVSMRRFAATGLGLNLIGIALIMLLTLTVLPHVPGLRIAGP